MLRLKLAGLIFVGTLLTPIQIGAEKKIDPVTSILMLDEYLPQLVKKIESSVVRVVAIQPKGSTFYGAGAIISPNGYILTAWHVIKDPGSAITVEYLEKLSDNEDSETHAVHMIPLAAKLIGYAPSIDLALLKIDAPNLPPLPLGDTIERGRLVIAIGHPFGRHTVTLGVVSSIGYQYKGVPFDLADAQINSGNSGGPLVNMRGELVGIYVARFFADIESKHEGLGGMVSVTDIKLLLPRLKKEGMVLFGYTGLKLRGYDPSWDEHFEALSFDRRDELLITDILQNSPAANAGLMPGDKIKAVNGKKFLTHREFVREVLYKKPGSTIMIDILRGNKSVHYKLRLGAEPPDPTIGKDESHEIK